MNVKVLFTILAVALASPKIEDNMIIMSTQCADPNGFVVDSFNISPVPVIACASQTVAMKGQFFENVCVGNLVVHEISPDGYTSDQSISVNQCFSNGVMQMFTFSFTPSQCVVGQYKIEVNVDKQSDNSVLGCWGYSFTI